MSILSPLDQGHSGAIAAGEVSLACQAPSHMALVDGGDMTTARSLLISSLLCLLLLPVALISEEAQMLDGEALARVVPGTFYFE